MLDVGQGQSIVLASEDRCALVDCGSANSWYSPGEEAAHQLMTMGCRKLDYLILTHPHGDHIGGLPHLLRKKSISVSEVCWSYLDPAMLKKTTGKSLEITLSSGRDFPEELSDIRLVIHCGGCMLNEREIGYRMRSAGTQDIPFTNYGIALAKMNGILSRSLSVFPELQKIIE